MSYFIQLKTQILDSTKYCQKINKYQFSGQATISELYDMQTKNSRK